MPWTVIGSFAGVGSLIVAVLVSDPGSSSAERPVIEEASSAPDSCLVGAWVMALGWKSGERLDMADGRTIVVSGVAGEIRYYFSADGRGTTEHMERVTGKLENGKAVWHKFQGRSDFRYSTDIKGQITYRDVRNEVSVWSQVAGEEATEHPVDVTVANDTYTCGKFDLVLTNAEPAEYRLKRQ